MMQSTGIGTYLRGILDGFISRQFFQREEVCLYGSNAEMAVYDTVSKRSFDAPIYSVQEQLQYPELLRECRLWHAPHYNVPWFSGQTALVTTIHDLIHWIYRKQFFTRLQALYAEKMLARAVQSSSHLITVSEHTKKDLVKYFNTDPEKVTVIHEGVNPFFKRVADDEAIERVKRKYGIEGPYFIYVGMLKPHKNVLWLYDQFRQMRSDEKVRSTLVIIGRKNEAYPAGYERYSEIQTCRGIIYVPQVELAELPALYSGSQALVHPSLYEGFGLTLLEAMACGTPVLAFRTASIPEIVGDSACLIEPDSQDELREGLIRLENDGAFCSELAAKGILKAGQYRWEDCAAKTIEVYERVLLRGS
jgi:glycosyltransferase involved in cell wall biosynthesis